MVERCGRRAKVVATAALRGHASAVPDLPRSSLWLGRYDDLLPVRSRASFHVVSARRADQDRRCTVIVPGNRADAAAVEEAFAEIARVHGLFEHPRIPRVTACGKAGDVPYLELGVETAADGADLVRAIGDSGEKMPYPSADGFIAGARLAMEAAHAVTDPRSGRPVCLGRLSYANFLFAPDGRWSLVGFGRNFPIEHDTGTPDGWVASFHAPEMSAGGAPSPMGDYAALLLFMRSMLPYAEAPPTLARMLRGELQPSDMELLTRLQWFDQNVLSQPPHLRPSMAEAVAVSDRIRELIGVTVDYEGFDAHVGELLRRQEPQPLEKAAAPGGLALTLGPEAAWVAGPGGERQSLGKTQRRIVQALVALHRERPGATLTMWEVFEAGWPGERPIREAGANRVYVTLARLRQLGLRDVVERFEDGYRIAPQATVRTAA